MLVHRLRRWPNIDPTMDHYLLFTEIKFNLNAYVIMVMDLGHKNILLFQGGDRL